MILSNISVKRPVFASVISLLLIAFGFVAYERLSLREYPDIDPPVVGIETVYRGAAASVVQTRPRVRVCRLDVLDRSPFGSC